MNSVRKEKSRMERDTPRTALSLLQKGKKIKEEKGGLNKGWEGKGEETEHSPSPWRQAVLRAPCSEETEGYSNRLPRRHVQ